MVNPFLPVLRRVHRLPWFIGAPAVAIGAIVLAVAANYFTADLFHETCLNERNPLTGEFEPSNCGEGAKVARASADNPRPDTGAPSPPTQGTASPTNAPALPPASTPAAGVLATGMFQDGDPGHDGAGIAEIQRLPDGSLNLLLKSFTVTNGPDLQIVLSRSANGRYSGDDLVLQKLKANNGTQNYAIPAGTDLSLYRSVVIWCRPFNIVFAYATLEVQ